MEVNLEVNLEGETEGDCKGDFRGDFKQDMEGDLLSSSGLVQVWFRLQLEFTSSEIDSEVGRLVLHSIFIILAQITLTLYLVSTTSQKLKDQRLQLGVNVLFLELRFSCFFLIW